MAPSSDERENYVAVLKVRSLPKKTVQTASKSAYKWQRNACSNYAPLERTALRTRSVTNKQKKLETKASSHQGQCIPAGSSVSPPKRVLITVSIITMRSISHKLCVRFLRFAKSRPQFSNLVAPSNNRYAKCLALYKAHLVL